MLLTSWVRNFRQSLRSKRRGHRAGTFQSQTWQASPGRRAATRTEQLEERTLLTAFVVDQQFADSTPGVISIDNSTIDIDNDGTPEFDSIVIDTVSFDGAGGRGISINLSDLTIDRISIDELNITGTQGSGVDITLNNVNLNALVIEKSGIASSLGGGIDLNLTDVVVPTVAVYQTSVLVTNGTGLDIDIASQTRNARVDEVNISESIIDGVSITAAGLQESVLTATGTNPATVTVVDHGLQDGTQVTVTGVQGLTAANTVDTITVVDENVFQLDNANGTGQTYLGGGTVTVYTTVSDIRVTNNTIGVSAGATGLAIDLTATRAPGLTVEGNASIRGIGIALDQSPIDGLTIRDTTIDATRPQSDALRFDLTSSTLTNVLIDNNSALGNGASGGDGVVFNATDSNVYGTFTNNVVDNTLGNGLSFSATATQAFLSENRGPLVFDFNSFAADTALTAALALNATTLQVADGRSFQAQQVIQIGNEQMFVTAVSGNSLTVVRGERGTLAVAHPDGSVLRSVTGASSGVARSISGNTFSQNDGAGFFTALATGTSVSADIRGNDFSLNQARAIDVTVQGTHAVSTQIARGGISRTASTLRVTDASVFSGFLLPFNIMVEGEEMTVTSIDGNNLSVTRAVNGSFASFHGGNVDVIAAQGDGLRLDIGGETAADGNTISMNRNGGIRITLQDDAAGSFDIRNNVITASEGLDADGISVNLTSQNSLVEARNILRRSTIDSNLIGVAAVSTLQANLSAVSSVFTVADASSFSNGQTLRIDGEQVTITAPPVGNTLTVLRGQNGTAANTHSAGAVVMPLTGGNIDRGIDFFFQELSAIEDIHVSNNVVANNGDDGIRFVREDDAVTRTVNPLPGQTTSVTIDGNTVSGNATNPEIDLDIDENDVGALEAYGAGVEIHVLNGTQDDFDVTISNNGIFANVATVGLPLGSQVDGINFRAEADARIVANVTRNRIRFNQNDGVHTSDRSNSGTDLRDISPSFFSNVISDNNDDGLDFTSAVGLSEVLVIGLSGTDANGVSLGNDISRNGNFGIHFSPGSGGARASITNNTINQNGRLISTPIGVNNGTASIVNGSGIEVRSGGQIAIKANTFDSNMGAGIDINSGGNFSIRNNTIQFNQNDGIEFLGSTDAVVSGNLISSNVGRGIDILQRGGSDNIQIGDGTEAGRNRVIGNQREAIYFVFTTSPNQNQNVEATVPLLRDGLVGDGGNTILQVDTNTVENNGIGSQFAATGLIVRQGSSQGGSGSYFTNDTGTATGIGSPDDLNPNSRTNARVVNNGFDGNFGDDVRFETFVSTVDPRTTGEPNDTVTVQWTDTNFVLPQTQYQSDPLARLNLVFQGNQGNGLNATAGGGGYNNVEPVFKSRDNASNANLTATPEDTDSPAIPGGVINPGPFFPPNGGARGRSITNVPSRSGLGPFDEMVNPAPDAVFPVNNVQAVNVGNGVTELEVTLGLDIFGEYNGVIPFNSGDFIEISGVNAIGGGIHTANGVFQVDVIDFGSVGVGGARVRLRGTTNENGPGYAGGGALSFQLNTPMMGPPQTRLFLYPGTGASTLRIAQGFDTAGPSASDQFSSGSNFNPGTWGAWAPNNERLGSVANVVADPSAPFTRMLVTAPNHLLGNNRIVNISGVEGIPNANGQFTIRVVDANTFSIPAGINGTYLTGGSWATVDDSFPDPGVPTFPLSDVVDVTPDPRTGNTGLVTLNFTEQVTDIDIDDLFLTRDGIPVDISSIFVQQITSSRYQVDFSSVTGVEGQYTLTIDNELPEASFVRISPDPRLTPVDNITVNFTENVTGVDIFDFTLLRDVGDGSGPQPVDLSEIGGNLAVFQVTPAQYTIDLSSVTGDEGSYELTLNAPRTVGVNSLFVNGSGEVEFNAPGHGLATGQTITLEAIRGATLGTATSVNGTFRVIVDDDDSFRLSSDGTLTTALAADDTAYLLGGSVISFNPGIIDQVGRLFSLTSLGADASAAIDWVRGAQAPSVDIIDVDPDPRSSAVNDVTFVFSEPVVVGQVDVSDFTLTRNIGLGPFPVSLSGATVTALDDPGTGLATTFVLSNIGALTSGDGDYRLTLITTGPTRIQDGQGNFLVFPALDDWTMINDEPAADILDVFPDPRTSAVGAVQFVFNNGDVTGVNLADAAVHFTLTRDSGDGSGPQNVSLSGLPITQNTPSSYSLDLTSVTSDMSGPIDGTYTLTLNPGTGITRVSTGAPLAVVASDTWVQDTTGPTAEILILDPDPRIQHAGVVTIQFDEPVQGVDVFNAASDFSLTRDIGDGNGAQPVSLVGTRVRAIGTVDASGNPVLPFSGGTIYSDTYILDLSRSGLTDIDGTYVLSILDTGAISDATGNAYVSTAAASDTWILVPKQINNVIRDVVFANNPVTQNSSDLFFTDTTAPIIVPGTVTVTPDPRSTSVGVVTVNFSEPVTGVNLTDFVLTRNGQNVSLAGLVVKQVSQSRYTIDMNLVTGAAGDYVLSIQGTNSLIQDLAGNPLQTGLITLDSWTVENIGPTATLGITPDPRMTPADNLVVSFTKPVDVSQVDLTDFRLALDAGNGFINIPITGGSVTPGGGGAFEDTFIVDLSADTMVEGTYRVTLVASNSGIIDQAGIELGADALTTFSIDNTAPTVDIIDIAPDPRLAPVGLVNILFDEAVTGIDLANAETDFNLLFDDGLGGGQEPVSLASLTVTRETGRRYTLDLSTVTVDQGSYELQIASNTGISDIAGNALEDAMLGTPNLGALDTWFNSTDIVNPTVDIVDVSTPRNTSAGVVIVNFSEDVSGVDIDDFELTRDDGLGAGPQPLDISGVNVTNSPGSASQYRIDLTDISFDQGTYTLRVITSDPGTPIVDASGNPLLPVMSNVADENTWLNTLIDPSAMIVPVTPDPRLRSAGIVTVNFTEDVTGVDIGDFRLTRDTGAGPLPVSLRGVVLMQSPSGPDQYLIDLTSVSGTDGIYRLTLVADGSGIESVVGANPVTSDAFDQWETVTTITVNTTSDTVDVNPGDGIVADSMNMVSLRAAIMEAGALPGNDTIILPANDYTLSIGGVGEQFAATGDLDIVDTTGTLTIIGAGADVTTISAGMIERIFHVTAGATLILEGVTITGGQVVGSEDGAGLRNDGGTVIIRNSVITGNRSFDDGGGINNAGTMTLIDTTVSGNRATNNGGGIRNVGNLTIINSTIGGFNDPVTMTDTRNLAGLNGGGIINLGGGTLTISNSTLSGNRVTLGSGGGLFNSGTGTLTNVTIASNTAGQRGGGLSASGGSLNVQNTIIADNTAVSNGNDVSVPGAASALVSLGNNLVENTADSMGVFAIQPTDITGTDPMLGVLRDNGGPTLTHALSLGSAAFDAGALTTATTDQRGIPRVLGNGVTDIGAYEFGGFFVESTLDSVDVNPGDGIVADNFGRVTLRAAIMESNALASSGLSVSNAIKLDDTTYDLNLIEIDTTAPTADVIDITPDPLGSQMSMSNQIDTIVVKFDEPVLNFDLSDLTLTFDDGMGGVTVRTVNTIAGTVLTQDTMDPTRYTVSGLRTALAADGLYTFDVNVSDITDFPGNALAEDPAQTGTGIAATDQFTRGADVFVPTATLTQVTPVTRTTNPGVVRLNFSENVFGVSTSAGAPNFTLTYDDGLGGGPVPVSLATVAVQQNSQSEYQLDLSTITTLNGLTDPGIYSLTFNGMTGIIQDSSGNLFTGSLNTTWTVVVDTFAPTVTIDPVTPDPRIGAVGLVTINFDEPVTGVDLTNAETDFDLTFDADGPGGMAPVAVSLSALTVTRVTDSQYTIDLTGVTAPDGAYSLSITSAGNIQDMVGIALGVGATDSWVVGDDVVTTSTALTTIVDLDFSQAVPGSIQDQAGLGTGFTTRLPGTGGALPANDPNLQLQTATGQLRLTSTQANIQGGANLGQLEAPGFFVPGIGQGDIQATGVFRNVQVPNGSDQLLIYFGTSAGSTVRAGFHEQEVYLVIENQGAGDVRPFLSAPASFNPGDDVQLTFGRINGSWELVFQNLTNPAASGSSGPLSFPFLDAQNDLYVGVMAANAGSATSFTATIDSFRVATTRTVVSNPAAFGDLDVTAGSLTIIGVGAGNSIVDANQIDRVFDVDTGVTFNLIDLTVTGGNVVGGKDGGGIRSNGTMSLTGAEVSMNDSDRNGGGIFSNGTLTLTTSSIHDNMGAFGGGVFNDDGTVTIDESLFNSNMATIDGGGFFNDRNATVNITGSVINGNMSGRDGAGLYNNDSGTAIITDSAVTRNTATGDGGGVFSELAATTTLSNSTVAFNTATDGGGLFNQDGVVTVTLSSISANAATNDGGGLFVSSNGVVNSSRSTFSGNLATFNGGGIRNSGTVNLDTARVIDNVADGSGGGINNTRTLNTQNTFIAGNAASLNGGGIANGGIGNLTLTSSSISNNTADAAGGGLHVSDVAGVTATFSTIDSNTASGQGGGVFQSSTGAVTFTSSTVSRNTGSDGGGIYSNRNFTFRNSTLSSNTATGNGGGLANNGGTVTLQNATIFGNAAAGSGGGIRNDSVFGPINIRNTIVARNTAATDVDVSGVQFASQGNNLIGDRGSVTVFVNGTGGNIVGTTGSEVNPLLGALQNNGGSTETHSLLFGSPARDGGSNVGVPATDQRGFARVFDGDGNGIATIDIGAFESGFIANTFADTVDIFPGDRSSADVDGNSSLRSAVMEANALAGDDTILLIPGTYRLTIAGRDENGAAKGDLDITDDLTIIGAGVDQTFINGAELDRIFHVLPGAKLSLKNLTIRNGEAVLGGAILNAGSLDLDNVVVETSTADIGGGLYNQLLQNSLAADITVGATSLTLNNASAFPAAGPFDIRIGSEEIRVSTVVGNSFTVTRGVNGTTAAAHTAGDTVTLVQELTITDSTVRNNIARLQGGGLFNQNNVTLRRATFSGNIARAQGGGLYNQSTATIIDSTFDSNVADANGGAIYNNAGIMSTSLITITGSTLSNNEAGTKGGGIYNNDFITILNSTLSGNRAAATGGGIFNSTDTTPGSITITNATIVENMTDGSGGGVVNDAGSTIDVQSTIISGNSALRFDDDVRGVFVSLGTNFIGDAGGSSGFVNGLAGDQVGSTLSPLDAVFGSLADNGGPTLTHALLTGSPAIDAGNNSGGDPVDQRGGRRPTDDTSDVGAFEIQDNRISIGNVTQVEGNGGSTNFVFTVLLEAATAEPITVNFTTVQDTARAGEDFLSTSGTVRFAPGDLTQTIVVEVNGDTKPEGDEQFFVQLSNPLNATLIDDLAVGTIQNDDAIITVAPASVAETDSGTTTLTFTVELLDAFGVLTSSANTITVNFATSDGTAVNTGPNPDYVATSGMLTFNPGETSKTVDVTVIGDTILEPDETVVLNLTGAMDSEGNAVAVANAMPTGSILNDETEINIDDVTMAEGDSGTTAFNFTVSLTQPNANTVTVNAATVNGSAISGSDFVANSTTLTFNPGETSKTFTVLVIGDNSFEPDEQFTVQLSNPTEGGMADPTAILNGPGTGTIQNDEVPPDEILIIRNGMTIEVYVNDNAMVNPPAQTGNLTDQLTVLGSNTNDDVFTVDFSGGNPIPTNNLVLDGQGQIGGDSIVIVNGAATDIVYTATGANSGTVDIDGSVISYSDFEPITDSLTANTRTFNITHAGGHTIRLTDDTSMVGHSLIDSNGMGQFESVSFANPSVSLTVNGSADADIFLVETLDPAFAVPNGSYVINTGDGADSLDGTASMQNLVVNGGAGGDTLRGGLGNDTIDGGADADSITGASGMDNLTGGADNANDTIDGGAGNDTIDGGMGDDSLSGGSENDDITAGDGNDVVSGGTGLDTIRGGLGNDVLAGDADSDTITGDGGDDVITGGAGADDLDGGADNDNVDGGDDADVVHGGDGNDIVSGGNGADMVFGDAGDDQLAGGGGVDQLDGGADTDSLTEVATGSENITLTNTTITVGGATDTHTKIERFNLTGGDLSGILDAQAFTLGNVTLNGAGGNDTLRGSSGNDSLIGGADNDLIQGNGGNDDLIGGSGNDTLQGGDGNDNLTGNSGNDLLVGDAGADFANGGDGNDTIQGGSGNDVLNGGIGDDQIDGGSEDDQLYGDDGQDTLNGGTGDDLLFGRNGNDSLLGGDGEDLLVGDDGDDRLDGQGDDDTLLGAAGVDTLFGGVGVDFLDGQGSTLDEIVLFGTTLADTFTLQPFGSFVILTKTSGTPYAAIFRRTEKVNLTTLDGDDTITSGDVSAIGRVDFIVDLGAGNDSVNMTGSNSSQFILFAEGRAGMDSIIGGLAADVINGGDDADSLDGANGNDTLRGGGGNDFLLGNRGNDFVDAGDGDDSIIGAAGADILNGGNGADTIRGNGGFDTINGGDGNDSLYGDGSADTIFGGAGNDRIAGRHGNDDLYGEAGNDTLIGEEGEDFLDGGENVDLLAGGLGNDALVGSFGNDILLGQEDNDTLYGGAGRDLLFGMQGADFLKGQGTVRDTLVGGTGNNDEDPGDTYNASETNEIDNTFMLDTTLLTLLNF